ncbi:hypothetical protein pb186bvf_002537 [Paramecium bursaria]
MYKTNISIYNKDIKNIHRIFIILQIIQKLISVILINFNYFLNEISLQTQFYLTLNLISQITFTFNHLQVQRNFRNNFHNYFNCIQTKKEKKKKYKRKIVIIFLIYNKYMKKSTGFRSNSSQGFQKTLSKPLAEKISPFDKTWKNEKSMERKQLIQNYFGIYAQISQEQNALVDEPLRFNAPERVVFDQRFLQKSMTQGVEQNQTVTPPGVIHIKKFNFANVFEEKPPKDKIVIVQSLLRRFIAICRVKNLRKKFTKLLEENAKIGMVDQLIRHDVQSGETIIRKLEKMKKQIDKQKQVGPLGVSRDNPFYTCMIEMLGERGLLEPKDFAPPQIQEEINQQVPFIPPSRVLNARLRPKNVVKPKVFQYNLPDDGCGVLKAHYFKRYNRFGPEKEMEVKINEDYVEKQIKIEQQQQQKEDKRKVKLKGILSKNAQQSQEKSKNIYKSEISVEIKDDVEYDEEIQDEIPDDSQIPEEEIIENESQIQSVIQSMVKEDSMIDGSQIKESMPSAYKSGVVKESIQEDYEEDFEEQSIQPKQLLKKELTQEDDYGEDFESYKSQSVKDVQVKQPSSKIQPVQPIMKISEFVPEIQAQPIEIDPGWGTKRAKLEAEVLLRNYKNKYEQLRQVEVPEYEFEALKDEHIQQKRISNQVNGLINGKGDYYSKPQQVPTDQADSLYAKFQYEFQRLLSMNTLGTRFSKIINTTINKGAPNFDSNTIQRIMQSVEQQQQIVNQVLQSVLFQIQNLFEDKAVIQELKNYRQEMDQKLQWILFKQDKIVNDQLGKQLQQRDKDLRKFIEEQFEKQKKDLQLKVKVDSNSMKEALIKNQNIFQSYKFDQSAQSKKESARTEKRSLKDESLYQPDFEDEISQKQVTEQSEISQQSKDREVFETSQQSEIEWQDDIDLQENIFDKDQRKKDKDAQMLVDYLTDMLMKEIKQDLFPQRDNKHIPVTESEESDYKSDYDEYAESSSVDQQSKQQDTPKLIQIGKKQESKEDDFGMGGPAFTREELSKDFDLTDQISESLVPKDKEKVNPPHLVKNQEFSNFTAQILKKYGDQLFKKKDLILQTFDKLISQQMPKNETFGSLLVKKFKFIQNEQVKEQDALMIVNALEEQLGQQILHEYNQSGKQNLNQDFEKILKKSQQVVQKICEERISLHSIQCDNNLQAIKRQADKQVPLKECPQDEGLIDKYIYDEMKKLADDAPNHFIKLILKETIGEFDLIASKKKQK